MINLSSASLHSFTSKKGAPGIRKPKRKFRAILGKGSSPIPLRAVPHFLTMEPTTPSKVTTPFPAMTEQANIPRPKLFAEPEPAEQAHRKAKRSTRQDTRDVPARGALPEDTTTRPMEVKRSFAILFSLIVALLNLPLILRAVNVI
jgi:hypothetical protein